MDPVALRVAARAREGNLLTDKDMRHVTDAAEVKATEMETGAKDIRKALKDFQRIYIKDNRSEAKDGPAWDAAQKVFEKHKLPVPLSSLLTW